MVHLIPALRAFARRFCRSAEDADDLVQETLTRALSARHQYRAGTRLKSWLFTIMRNASCTRARRNQRERLGAVECASYRSTAPATQEWVVRGREFGEALGRLPADQRQILVLVIIDGASYQEAALACGCAMGTVKSRLNRARLRLLAELGEDSGRSLLEGSMAEPAPSHYAE